MSFITADVNDEKTKELIKLFLENRIGKKVALSIFTKTFKNEDVSTEPVNVTVVGITENKQVLFSVNLEELASADDTLY
jgi:hypothetical protein